jgi:hypothetical protein
MNLLIIEPVDEEMNLDVDSVDLVIRERSIGIFIAMDERYNLIVCKEYGIGLSSDWIVIHLKEYHGVRTIMEEALAFLEVGDNTMILVEAENWIQGIWVGTAVQNIPVVKGFQCNECQYSAVTMKVMINHFGRQYKGLKSSGNTERCKVQLVFKGGL